mgnify:CR=1 FL=1
MAKPLLTNKDARDKFAQQAGAKDYDDLVARYSQDPEWWTANKGKITGDDSYTPEAIQNYIDQDIMNRKGNKSAPAPSANYNEKAVAANPELANNPNYTLSEKDLQVGSITDVNPVDAAIGRIRAGEATDEDLKLAFESGYEGGPATQAEYQRLGLTGIDTTEIADTLEEANEIAQPQKGDTKAEKAAKKKYRQSTMSIFDALHNGEIDPETAGYFTVDAIATLASNLGRGIGNVGAQFTGGTIDNNKDTSKWEQRQNELFNEEVQMEKEGLGGPAARRAKSEELGLESQGIQNEVARIRANYTDEQIQQQIAMMDKQLEQMGLNIENMEDARTFVETLKAKPESERTWLDNLMIAWMSQSGVNAAISTGSSGIGSLISLLAK